MQKIVYLIKHESIYIIYIYIYLNYCDTFLIYLT